MRLHGGSEQPLPGAGIARAREHAANAPDTAARLLQAAGRLFAEQGFRLTSVRQIVEAAGANLNSIKRQFGGKRQLYTAVLRQQAGLALTSFPMAPAAPGARRDEADLAQFVQVIARRILDPRSGSRMPRLMLRELADPTDEIERVVAELVGPNFRVLCAAVRNELGKGFTALEVQRCAYSVVAQIWFHLYAREIVRRLTPQIRLDPCGIERLAQHIGLFCSGALAQLRRARGRSARRRRAPRPAA
jgi:AcrR family transcriptional regulator